jgi:hypothetical protein
MSGIFVWNNGITGFTMMEFSLESKYVENFVISISSFGTREKSLEQLTSRIILENALLLTILC